MDATRGVAFFFAPSPAMRVISTTPTAATIRSTCSLFMGTGLVYHQTSPTSVRIHARKSGCPPTIGKATMAGQL